MIKTLIIDDEPIALEKLRTYVEKTPQLELVGACDSAFDAMEYVNDVDVNLIITDINMPDLNGLDFVKTLKNPPMVIFITAYADYAVESYSVSAVDYLLKPYGYVEFSRAVNKAAEAFALRKVSSATAERKEDADSIFFKVDYRYVRVSLADIRYIKGYGEYLQVYVEGEKNPIVTLSSFAAIKERLTDSFVQVHRSYIVNMNRVQQIERSRVVMDADTYIPVGESYKMAFQEYLARHSAGRGGKS